MGRSQVPAVVVVVVVAMSALAGCTRPDGAGAPPCTPPPPGLGGCDLAVLPAPAVVAETQVVGATAGEDEGATLLSVDVASSRETSLVVVAQRLSTGSAVHQAWLLHGVDDVVELRVPDQLLDGTLPLRPAPASNGTFLVFAGRPATQVWLVDPAAPSVRTAPLARPVDVEPPALLMAHPSGAAVWRSVGGELVETTVQQAGRVSERVVLRDLDEARPLLLDTDDTGGIAVVRAASGANLLAVLSPTGPVSSVVSLAGLGEPMAVVGRHAVAAGAVLLTDEQQALTLVEAVGDGSIEVRPLRAEISSAQNHAALRFVNGAYRVFMPPSIYQIEVGGSALVGPHGTALENTPLLRLQQEVAMLYFDGGRVTLIETSPTSAGRSTLLRTTPRTDGPFDVELVAGDASTPTLAWYAPTESTHEIAFIDASGVVVAGGVPSPAGVPAVRVRERYWFQRPLNGRELRFERVSALGAEPAACSEPGPDESAVVVGGFAPIPERPPAVWNGVDAVFVAIPPDLLVLDDITGERIALHEAALPQTTQLLVATGAGTAIAVGSDGVLQPLAADGRTQGTPVRVTVDEVRAAFACGPSCVAVVDQEMLWLVRGTQTRPSAPPTLGNLLAADNQLRGDGASCGALAVALADRFGSDPRRTFGAHLMGGRSRVDVSEETRFVASDVYAWDVAALAPGRFALGYARRGRDCPLPGECHGLQLVVVDVAVQP